MRKYLTAKLFKRLALAALIVSLVGWGMSAFYKINVMASHIDVAIFRGAFYIHYIQRDGSSGMPMATEWRLLSHHELHFPAPDLNVIQTKQVPPTRICSFQIPFWLSSLMALAAFLFFRRLDRRSAIRPGCCVHCGYDASRCTDNRCSECGEPLAAESVAAG